MFDFTVHFGLHSSFRSHYHCLNELFRLHIHRYQDAIFHNSTFNPISRVKKTAASFEIKVQDSVSYHEKYITSEEEGCLEATDVIIARATKPSPIDLSLAVVERGKNFKSQAYTNHHNW